MEGQFSYVDFRLNQHNEKHSNVIRELKLVLPKNVNNVYVKDAIGNVSTTHLRKIVNGTQLEIRPRYPLFGGWKYTWFYGFETSISDYVRVLNESLIYQAQVPFYSTLKNASISKAVLTVVLPEGASYIKIT